MKRREFLTMVARWSAGLAVVPPLLRMTPALLAAERPEPILSVGTGTDYPALVERVLQPFGGLKTFVKQGATVVVKPNIGWDRSPEQAANTNPQVVQTVVKMALDAGAGRVHVFDRTCNDERRTYANSGIKEAVEAIADPRVVCSFIDQRKFVPVTIERGKAVKSWEFYDDALQAQCYINLPIAKDHGLAGLTLGMKNVMGVIGGRRGSIHQDLGQSLADMGTVIRPTITIIDATRILLRNGPQGGSLRDVRKLDTILASVDTVAADAYATKLFDRSVDDITSTMAAYEMGLGEKELTKVKIVKA